MPRTANDDPDRSRILLREFKKRRQPKRCDSLPCFQAVPATRQLYLCHRCRFTNTICKICPWCLSPCDVAAQVAVSLVRRRLSSPMLLSDAQKMQLAKIERATNPPPTVAALLPTAARSSPSPARGGVALSHEAGTSSTIPPRSTRRLPGASADAEADDLRRRHRNAALYSATDVVATMTEDSTLQPFLDQIAAARSEGRAITTPEPLIATPPHSVRTSWDALSPMSRTSRPRTPGSPSSPGPRGRMLNGDGPIMYPSERPPSKLSAPLSPTSHSSTPCLRHKRRMPALRQRSSCHLRRRSTSSVSSCRRETGNFSSPASSPRPKTATTATSPPGSPQPKTVRSIRFGSPSPGPSPGPVLDEIPLGHPQRPLYTAIRKNMSRPESPTPSAAASASFDFHVYERGTRSLDIDDAPPALRYGSLARASQLAIAYNTAAARPALFGTATGFSVSGETEMRMDLARSRSMDGVPGDFAFREGKRGRQEGASTSVKARVKSLGKTLKGLLRVKN